jgi:hypothetical protein
VVITFVSPPESCDQGSPEFTMLLWSLDILRKGRPPGTLASSPRRIKDRRFFARLKRSSSAPTNRAE